METEHSIFSFFSFLIFYIQPNLNSEDPFYSVHLNDYYKSRDTSS